MGNREIATGSRDLRVAVLMPSGSFTDGSLLVESDF